MKKLLIIAHILLLLPQLSMASRVSPVDNGKVTSGVGWRIDPFGSGRMTYHSGYDIAVPVGTPVHPTQAGTVYFAGPYKGYGNLVVVEHGQGYVTMYGHNSEILVKAGEKVDTATVLALSVENNVKTFVVNNIDGMVNDAVQGKGGGEVEALLPGDIDE